MMEWAIFYDDPELDCWSVDGVTPEDVPRLGVQAVAQGDEWLGRELLIQKEFYWLNYEEMRWYGGDLFGLFDYLSTTGPKTCVFGRFVNRDVYQAAVHRAQHDERLPRKSAYSSAEKSAYPNGLEAGI